jgi:NADPH-dependent curcumin reductase CurA
MPAVKNRRIVLAARPEGYPLPEHFRLEEVPVPSVGDGEVLIKNLYLSLDPYMRGRMSERASYARPVALGEVMVGGTVAEVVESRAEGYAPGDIVVGYGGWQDYTVVPGGASGPNRLLHLPSGPDDPPISTALGAAGMPGCTAYFGLFKVGEPKAGETLVVSAAAGAVGSVVGQLGKEAGCRVVGIAGGPAKCGYCTDELGFDACVDYKSAADLPSALAAACPRGIDVYFENVGGEVTDAVVTLLNPGSRVPICGIISQYNEREPAWPSEVLEKARNVPRSRFFLVWEWPEEYEGVATELRERVRAGRLRYREDIVPGLENAPSAFTRLFSGENFGKLLVVVNTRGVAAENP